MLVEKATVQLAARSQHGRDLLVQMAPFGQELEIAAGIIINLADITELQTEDRLRTGRLLFEAQQRALVTLHSIADAVISVDAGGTVEYLNPAAEQLTGWPLPEAQGRPLEEVFRPLDEAQPQARAAADRGRARGRHPAPLRERPASWSAAGARKPSSGPRRR